MDKKLLSIGHATHDTFLSLEIEDAQLMCDVQHRTKQVCFLFGSKIPVKDIHYSTGGGACNSGVGIQKLGISVSIYCIVGKDRKGEEVLENLKSRNLDVSNIVFDDNPTDQAAIISYAGERTLFTYNYPRNYKLEQRGQEYSYIFVSSVGQKVGSLYDEIIEWKKQSANRVVFYNPGSKELRSSNDAIEKFVGNIDYLIANIEEGCLVLNPGLKREHIEEHDLINLLVRKGIKNVILTDAENGVYIGNEQEHFHLPAKTVNVVEKTGAGDAFASGFIGGIMNGKDIRESAIWGIINGASVIQVVGAQNGLLTVEKIEEGVKNYRQEMGL